VLGRQKGKGRKEVFFFEKKKQKTFVRCRGFFFSVRQKT